MEEINELIHNQKREIKELMEQNHQMETTISKQHEIIFRNEE